MTIPTPPLDIGWNADSARYVDLNTGRFLSLDFVLGVGEDRIAAGIASLETQLLAVTSGGVDIALWQDAFAQELKYLHTQMMALGRGGWGEVTQSDWGRVGARLKAEYGFLDDLVLRIANGEMSEAEIANSLRMFSDGALSEFWKGHTAAKIDAGAVSEQRFLDFAAEHCADCRSYASRGIVPIGTLPEPGERSQCLSNCRCRKVYYRADGSIV